MSVLWDPNHPKYYKKLQKDDAQEDTEKAVGTVCEESEKKMTSLLFSF